MSFGLGGLPNVGQSVLMFLLAGASIGQYYRNFVSETSPSGWIGPNGMDAQPIVNHSAYFDAVMDVPLDSLSPDLGTGYSPPYPPPIAVHCLIHRGMANSIWSQFGINIDEDDTYGIFSAKEIVPYWHDIISMPDGNTYGIAQNIQPLNVLDVTIGYIAQMERRDPSDRSIYGR